MSFTGEGDKSTVTKPETCDKSLATLTTVRFTGEGDKSTVTKPETCDKSLATLTTVRFTGEGDKSTVTKPETCDKSLATLTSIHIRLLSNTLWSDGSWIYIYHCNQRPSPLR